MINSACQKLELKIIPVVVFIICAMLMLIFSVLLPRFSFDFSGRLFLVVALIFVGISLILANIYVFMHAQTSKSPSNPESASNLVTWGIYRFTRNPMYLGGAFNAMALALLIANLSAFIFVLLFIIYINRFQIKPEERILKSKFAQAFCDYTRQTRRWI